MPFGTSPVRHAFYSGDGQPTLRENVGLTYISRRRAETRTKVPSAKTEQRHFAGEPRRNRTAFAALEQRA